MVERAATTSRASERRIVLARHGETEWNRLGRFQGQTDVALNDTGRAQARALGERLRGRGVGAVVASDLSRAKQTAEIAAEALGVTLLYVDAELRERGYGVFEGLTREECEARHPDEWATYLRTQIFEPSGAEPRPLVRERMVRALERVVDRAGRAHEVVLVVCHGGAMRAAIEAITREVVPPVANGTAYELLHDGRAFAGVKLAVSDADVRRA